MEGVQQIEEEILAEPEDTDSWNDSLGIIIHPVTGWILVAVLIIIAFSWNKLQRYFDQLYEKDQQKKYDARAHKDPDWVMSNHEKMDIARRKMQERYDLQAAQYKIKEAEKTKQKKIDKLNKTAGGEILSGGSSKPKNERPDYNPLIGDSTERYRPQKKKVCPGGDCGN